MKKSPSLAKITRPRVKDVLQRERLFSILDDHPDQAAFWITGPPGSGKTTLVSSYIEARKLPTLWYRLDEDDADPASFFYYLGLAGKKAAPRKKKTLPLFTPEYRQGLPLFSKSFFRDLYSRLKPPFLLVFDNYHAVAPASPLDEIIRQGLSEIPDGVSVVIMSRSIPPPSLSRTRLHERLRMIDWKQLRMDRKEVQDLIRMKREDNEKACLTEAEIKGLHERSGGWMAGLLLLLKRGPAIEASQPGLKGDAPDLLFGYFTEEILEKMGEGVRAFLYKTALLPRMTIEMANKMSVLDHADEILRDLQGNHFFTERIEGDVPVYSYHDLFREFLQEKGAAVRTKEEQAGLTLQTAEVLEEAGWLEDALPLYIETKQWPKTIGLILGLAPQLMAQGRYALLETWIEGMPPGLVSGIPWLGYWKGLCRVPINPVEARKLFEVVYEQFKQAGDPLGQSLVWASVAETYFIEWSNLSPLDPWIDEIDALMARHPVFPSPEVELRVLTNIVTALTYRKPQHLRLDHFVERLLVLIQMPIDINIRIMAVNSLLLHWMTTGNLSKGNLALKAIARSETSKDVRPLYRIIYLCIKANIGVRYRNENKACIAWVKEGLELAATSGIHAFDILLGTIGAQGALSAGEMEAADTFLGRSASLLDQRTLHTSYYHYIAGLKAFSRGKHLDVRNHLKTALDLSMAGGMPFLQALCHIAMTWVCHERGEVSAGAVRLASARQFFNETKSLLIDYLCLLLEAQAALIQGQDDRGIALLRRGFSLGRERGYLSHPWWVDKAMAFLCVKALEAGIEVAHVKVLIQGHGLMPEEPPVEIENWPWPVRIYTLGRFSVLIDGKPLKSKRKIQQRPLDLLKALIALGGRDISKERLADVLWPEAEGDAGDQAFAMTLHRLRAIIGHDSIKQERSRLTLDNRLVWTDIWMVERLFNHVKRIGTDHPETGAFIEEITSLCQGPFLKNEETAPWVMPTRDRLQGRLNRCLLLRRTYLSGIGAHDAVRDLDDAMRHVGLEIDGGG